MWKQQLPHEWGLISSLKQPWYDALLFIHVTRFYSAFTVKMAPSRFIDGSVTFLTVLLIESATEWWSTWAADQSKRSQSGGQREPSPWPQLRSDNLKLLQNPHQQTIKLGWVSGRRRWSQSGLLSVTDRWVPVRLWQSHDPNSNQRLLKEGGNYRRSMGSNGLLLWCHCCFHTFGYRNNWNEKTNIKNGHIGRF